MTKKPAKKVTSIARTRTVKPRITHSVELVAAILDRVAKGEPLSKVCDSPDMPTRKSFFEWLEKYPEIVPAYKLAIDMRADLYAEEIIEIADDGRRDYTVAEDGREVPDHDHIARSRLRVDARKWYASKLAPKRYGEKLDLDHGVQSGSVLEAALLQQIGTNPASRIVPNAQIAQPKK